MAAKHGLGRLPFKVDHRDDSYTPMRLAAMVELGLAKPIAWKNTNPILDQGKSSECVAFGLMGLLNTDDSRHNDPRNTNAKAHAFFKTIPGAGPNGAYIRNGLAAAKVRGLVAAYALLHDSREIDEWLANHGPVLVGSLWTPAMQEPVSGLVRVDTTACKDGHCYFWYGQNTYYRLGTNSWSREWGENGLFHMRRCDDDRLQRAGGEAWAVLQPIGGAT